MRKFITFAAALLLCAASYAAVINVYTTDDLTNAVAYSSDTIRLRNDIVIKDGVLSIPAKKTCVIDLNNHFIRCDISKRSDDFLYAIKLGSDANLTLINGEVACNNTISDSFFALIQKVGAVYLAEKGAVLNLDRVSLVGLLRGSAQPSNYGLALGEQNNLTVNARFSDIKGIRSKNSAYTHTLNMYHVTLGDEERKTKENGHGLKVDNGDNLQGEFAEGDLHGTNLSAAQLLALIPEKGSEYYTLSGEESTEVTRAQVAAMTDLQEISLRVLQTPKFTVAGVVVSDANCNDILGDGKVRFDYLTNTLYLETKEAGVTNTIEGNIVFNDFKLNIVVDGEWRLNGHIEGHDGDLIIEPAHYALTLEDGDFLEIRSLNATGISLNGKSFCTKNRVKVLVDDNATGTQSAVSCGAFVVTNAWFSASGKKPLVTCTNTVISKASIEYGSLKNDNIVRIVPQITQYYLHVQSNGSDRGTVTGEGWYNEGVEATITATAKSGFYFDRWMEDKSRDAVHTVTVTKDTYYTAIFFPEEVINYYNINVVSADEEMGTVSGGGKHIEAGKTVTVKAQANPGYEFLYWMDSREQVVSGMATWGVTVSGDETYTAHFRVAPPADAYNLWVCGTQVTGSNSNDILGDGVWCYDDATRTLTVMKDAKYEIPNDGFIEDWYVGDSEEPLTVKVGNHTVEATCTTTDEVIRTALVGTKGITFTGTTYHGIILTAQNMYVANVSQPLTVTGHMDLTLNLKNTTDWGRDHFVTAVLLGSTKPSLIVDGANLYINSGVGEGGGKGYKATNKTDQAANLSMNNASIQWGSMSDKDLGIMDDSPKYEINYITPSLESLCLTSVFGLSFFEGTHFNLYAYPAPGYKFVQWSDGNEDNPRLIIMPAHDLYLDPIVEEDGSLVPKGAIISADATEGQGSIAGFTSGWYEEGSVLTITAEPAEGYEFLEWSDGTTANPYTLTVQDGKNISLTALFYEKGSATGIEDVQRDDVQCTKVLVDGVLYILRDGKIYNAQGANVK